MIVTIGSGAIRIIEYHRCFFFEANMNIYYSSEMLWKMI